MREVRRLDGSVMSEVEGASGADDGCDEMVSWSGFARARAMFKLFAPRSNTEGKCR